MGRTNFLFFVLGSTDKNETFNLYSSILHIEHLNPAIFKNVFTYKTTKQIHAQPNASHEKGDILSVLSPRHCCLDHMADGVDVTVFN